MQADAILAIARRRAGAAEVFTVASSRTVIEFRGGRFHSHETRLARGCGLRVVKDGRLGFASSTNEERYDALVDAALETAALGRPARFGFAGPAELPPLGPDGGRPMLHPPGRIVDWGRELCSAMRSRVPELRLDLVFNRELRETSILTTAGLAASFERTTFELDINGVIAGDGISLLPDYLNLSAGDRFDPCPLCDRLEAAARGLRRRARLTSGTWPVIVMPLALPALLVPLAAGVSGRQLEKGTSPLIGREGERVLADCLTLTDNPLRRHGPATAPFDGEGVPSRVNPLFARGVFSGFLHDLDSAAACGCRSTGSARRDYDSPPAPGPACLELAPGTTALARAVADTRAGLLVLYCVGGGQSNILAGEVALNLTAALKIEGGELVGRVKDVMLADNIYRMLSTVDRVGDEPRDTGRDFLPWLSFPALKLAARD